MLKAAEAHPEATAFYCNADIIDEKSQPTFSLPDFYKGLIRTRNSDESAVLLKGDAALARLLRGWFVMCPTICYRLSRLGDRRFTSRWRMVVDVELIAGLLLAGDTLVGLPGIFYQYRRHSANQTSLLSQEVVRFEEESNIYDILGGIALQKKWLVTVRIARAKRIIKLNLAYCILRDLLAWNLSFARRKAKLLIKIL